MQSKKRNSYNDGVCGVYAENSTLINTDFNAKTNAKTIDDFTFIMWLYFDELNKRDEDFIFAEAMGKKLTMKIKTPLCDGIEPKHKIIIGNQVYDIIKIDPDKTNRELYFYLEGGRKL